MNWENPYIQRVLDGKNYIAACPRNQLTQADRDFVQKKRGQFTSIFCEPCCGSGNFLVESALRNTSTLFVGFEVRYKRAARTAEKALRLALNNLIVVRHDAAIISELFPPCSLAGVAVNFPDPWDKRRWQKNRLLTVDYLNTIAELLTTGGTFAYKTDHQHRFEEVLSALSGSELFETAHISRDLHSSSLSEENIVTEFESLFCTKGLPIYYLLAHKLPG